MSPIQDGAWLDNQVFPEPSWCVPGILPEGCCILSGHPKIGKSFLVLDVALAAASGGTVLGVEVQARPVLYMALEDDPRRLQQRSRILLDDEPLPSGFSFMTRYDTEGAMEVGKAWVESHCDEKPLVIVDTLEKIRGGRTQNAYSDDYQAGTLLQSLLAKGGTVIAVHHNRKGDSEDFLDQVSGTLGLRIGGHDHHAQQAAGRYVRHAQRDWSRCRRDGLQAELRWRALVYGRRRLGRSGTADHDAEIRSEDAGSAGTGEVRYGNDDWRGRRIPRRVGWDGAQVLVAARV